MKKIRWPIILLVLNLAVISGVVICFMNLRYPMVGHDYSGLPYLLETYLHFRLNGLSIQWYAPNFGGGLPAFPNPNNVQFSLWQILVFFFSPWQTAMISMVICVVLGGCAGFHFFYRLLKLHWTSSILGTVFFCATGYYMERMAAGHMVYQTFPFLAILIVVILDASLPKGIAGLIFALVVALLIQQAGYLLIITFGLSFLIIFPLLYIYRPAIISWKRIIAVIALGGMVAVVILASKLAAVYAYMRFFPRQIADTYPTAGILKGLFGIILQLLGTMNLAPLLKLIGAHPGLLTNYMISVTGAEYGYWEFDMSMSPIVFGIIIIGIYGFFRKSLKNAKLLLLDKKWVAWILLILFTWLTIEFTLAKGLIYPFLQKLPILSSLHVNPRFAVAFLFPLAMSAAVIYNKWTTSWSNKKSTIMFLVMNVFTLIPLSAYFMIHADVQNRNYNIIELEKIYAAIRAGDTLNITGIGDSSVSNTQALSMHLSNLAPYDPIFGYGLENFHPEIHVGSIWDISDGYYNMTNPSGYVFPELNGTRPFERIPVSEKNELEAFASHKQPDWKIPLYQQILDWVSGLTFAMVALILVLFGIKQLVIRFIGNRLHS